MSHPFNTILLHHVFLKKEEKIVLQRKNILENILVKLQRDKYDIIMFHPFTTNHSCIITTSRGLSQKAWKEENVLQNILHFE